MYIFSHCEHDHPVMRLDLGNSDAVMFRNRAHGGLNVVYRRSDGNIGWIDPEYAKENA